MSTEPRPIGVVARRIALGVGILVFAGWLVFLRPQALGGPAAYITVAGTSMKPTLGAGDLVVMTKAETYEPGDIVAYRVPQGDPAAGRLVIHRVIGGAAGDGYLLQGDNTGAPDMWRPTEDDIVGRQLLVLPALGSVLMLLQSPAALAGLAAALLVFWLPLWKEPRSTPDPTRGRSRVRAPSLPPARVVKVNEALLVRQAPDAARCEAQVLVEFRNDGERWAEIRLADSSFSTIDGDGSVTCRGHFSSVYPPRVGPGATGYMLADVPDAGLTQSQLAGVLSVVAYRDATTRPVWPKDVSALMHAGSGVG